MPRLVQSSAIFASVVLTLAAGLAASAPAARADLLVSGTAGIARYDETSGQYLGTLVSGTTYTFAVGPNQNIYTFNPRNVSSPESISRYDGATGAFLGSFVSALPDFHPASPGADTFAQLAFSPDGNSLYLLAYSNLYNDTHVIRYDGTTGQYIQELVHLNDTFTNFGVGPNGNVYIDASLNGAQLGAVRGFDGAAGSLVDAFYTYSPADGLFILEPGLFAFDAAGDFYTAGYKFDGQTHALIGEFPISVPGELRGRFLFGPDGNIYALLHNHGDVYRFDGATGAYIGQFTVGAPDGVAYDLAFAELPPLVPEPSTLLLLGAGLVGLLMSVRRKRALLPPLVVALLFGSAPEALADLFVNSSAGLLRYDEATGHYLSTVIPTEVDDFGFGPDGNLYVCKGCLGSVEKFDPVTGASLGIFTSGTPDLGGYRELMDGALDLGFGPDGEFYLLAGYGYGFNSAVLRYDGATGAYDAIAVSQGLTGDVRSIMEFGPGGTVYLSGSINAVQGFIRPYDLATGQAQPLIGTVIAPDGPFVLDPDGFAFGPDGLLYLPSVAALYRYDPAIQTWLDSVTVNLPQNGIKNGAFTFGSDGLIYFGITTLPGIYRADPLTGEYLGRFDLGGPDVAPSSLGFSRAAPVPEPATASLLAVGLAGLLRGARLDGSRSRQRKTPSTWTGLSARRSAPA